MSSSPPRKYKTFSPIRDLEQRYSPSKGLDIILQEQSSLKPHRSYNRSSYRSYTNNNQSEINSRVPSQYYADTKRVLIENNKLKNDNQILATSQNFTSFTYAKQLQTKDKQLEGLRRQFNLVQDRLEKQNTTLRFQNENLKKNYFILEGQKAEEIALIRSKYSTMPEEQRELIKKGYNDDITKTLTDLQTAHRLLQQKQKQLDHLSALCKQNSFEYGLNLQDLITQNNILKNKLAQYQASTERQIREITAKKQLEKSRTQGIISYCKENTLYIEKQIVRLADELLKKNISIQSFNRQITKYQRLIEDQGKRSNDQLHRQKKEYQTIINDKQTSFAKIQKQFKLDLVEKKKLQMELVDKISTLENQVDTLNKKLEHAHQIVNDKKKIIHELKDSIERKQDDHAREISKVMSNSRIGRKSMKNLSSYSSFKDIDQAQGSSIIKSGKLKRQESLAVQQGGSSPLPTVHEENNLAQSQGFALGGDEQFDAKELIIHYESLVEQLKRNKMTELQIANNKIQNLKQSLNQKQQQILDILNRFSPLMEYKINKESIDEERRRRIEEHHKGDIDLLSVMLGKYDIVALRSRKQSSN